MISLPIKITSNSIIEKFSPKTVCKNSIFNLFKSVVISNCTMSSGMCCQLPGFWEYLIVQYNVFSRDLLKMTTSFLENKILNLQARLNEPVEEMPSTLASPRQGSGRRPKQREYIMPYFHFLFQVVPKHIIKEITWPWWLDYIIFSVCFSRWHGNAD